ncbi:MAG: tyrosine-type recombinase/integrase [Candidatus Dormibacteraeota bacterium]|nr:tyrosine-type recombinase/integrase [Candidatus Dormibacteraeota bacterium]MBJ7613695.1 tyrosine-type recombinase/integrase [Candidatus Dormibacteraeota bacterium]
MTTDALPSVGTPQIAPLAALDDAARSYAEASRSKATRDAYGADWRDFSAWCQLLGATALPAAPSTLRQYFAQLAQRGVKAATIARRVAAISKAHQLAGVHPPPTREETVKATLAGIRRTIGTAQASKAGISIEELRRMVAACDPASKAGLRDRALLVLAFAGAFRRSELVSLDVADVEQVPDGLRILVRRSKTDQEAAGKRKPLPYGSNPATCPVRTLAAWLSAAEITEGPIFRSVNRHDQVQPGRLSDQSVALVVKRAGERAGLDPIRLAGHSLRRGFATTAARRGVADRTIMRHTWHRSRATLDAYIEAGTEFTDNAASYVGL